MLFLLTVNLFYTIKLSHYTQNFTTQRLFLQKSIFLALVSCNFTFLLPFYFRSAKTEYCDCGFCFTFGIQNRKAFVNGVGSDEVNVGNDELTACSTLEN